MSHQFAPHTVAAWEEQVIMPTYVAPPPDPNPMFLDKRVNQGATGRVYPNPFTDRLSSERVDQAHRAIFLENDYVQLMVFPDLGGRIQAARDKSNGFDFVYRQHVIKPALIGPLGSWISGGAEFNWPQHHRPSTFMPVDAMIERHPDGSATICLGEHEPIDRTRQLLGIRLHPDKAYIEFQVRLYNRTPYAQTFLWWVNWAVHTHDQYQVVFPPDVTVVTDHSKRAMARYPVPDGAYYGIDYTGVDISWPGHIPGATSYFAWASQYDYFGGYDHARDAGVIHVANHHVSPGKKMFTWGTGDFGQAWGRNLTDADGPYIELMAGVYTDNQPDFSWIQPYESKSFSQFWYPVQQIGPAQNANRRAAISLRAQEGAARVGVCVTESLPQATVTLSARGEVFWQQTLDISPGSPLVTEVALPADVAETDITLRLCDRAGLEVIRYRPSPPPHEPLPEAMTPQPPPDEIDNIEQLYLTGLHLEQYKHPTMEPEPYWERALRMDPGDVRCNNALGLAHLRRGSLALAESYFRRAIQTWTRRNPNPRDGEPYHNLGLALQAQGRYEEAYDAYYKAIWSYAWQAASYYALAQIDALRGDLGAALEHLDRSLLTNAANLKARDLKAALLRRLGRLPEALQLVQATMEMDKLDYWAGNELILLYRAQGALAPEGAPAEARATQALAAIMRGDGGVLQAQRYLDLAYDYAGAGLWAEASDVLRRLVESKSPGQPVYPMVLYTLGRLARQLGHHEEAQAYAQRAMSMPPDYCFPFRLEEMDILEQALADNPDDARAHYYLGNLLYDKKRHKEAMRHWEAATRLEPQASIPWRNLGLAHYNVLHDRATARACYEKALQANPHDARLLSELDQLLKRQGEPSESRLALLEQHLDLVQQRDDLTVERATLYNQLRQPEKALQIVLSRRFHPWEGGEGRVSDQYESAHIMLGRAALEAGRASEALAHFEQARTFPENLGEGRFATTSLAHLDYWTGRAYEAMGEAARAAACYQRAAAPQTVITAATYYRAQALRHLGQEEAARQQLQAILDYAHNELEAAMRRGFDTSVPQFIFFEEDALKPRRIALHYLTGLAYLGLNQSTDAAKVFHEVLALDGNHLGAQEELCRLS